ncbi:MAG: hypothetical protein QM534_15855 [Sediminibacterium sp.]|nr:hypothetical protein [Sediminibacterium sp.]
MKAAPLHYWLFIFLLAGVCGTGTLSAQTALQQAAGDLRKVKAYYDTHPQMSMDTYYMAFDEHHTLAPKETSYGTYIRNGKWYYTRMLHVETFSSSDLVIVADHEEKQVVVADQTEEDNAFAMVPVDSLLQICSSVTTVKSQNPGEKGYSMNFEDGEYSRIEFYIDAQYFRFTRIVLFYDMAINLSGDYYGVDKRPRLEVMYKNYKHALTQPDLLEKQRYVTQHKDGSIDLMGSYKGYALLDQRRQALLKK